jgi:hypothetical protein
MGATGCAALTTWGSFEDGSKATVRDGGLPDSSPSSTDADGGADASPAGPITFVQQGVHSIENGFASSADITLSSPLQAGDLIVVAIGMYDATATVTSVTDQNGNHFRVAVDPILLPGSDPIIQTIWYASGVGAAASDVVTVALSKSVDSPDIRVVEYSGLDPTEPLDAKSSKTGNDKSSTSGPVTTTYGRELLFAAGTTESHSGYDVGGTGFTARLVTTEGNIAEDRFVDAPGTYSADAPLVESGEWVFQLATFH